MTTEVRVGLFAILGVTVLLVSVAFLTGGLTLREGGYDLYMRVANAGGITVSAPVQMAGIQVGRVRSLDLTPERQAVITIRIREGVTIPTGSRFAIATAGLLGDRFITITPGPPTAAPIPPRTTVTGADPFTLEELTTRIVAVARQAEVALANLNRLVGDPELPAALSEAVRNTRETSVVIRRAAGNIERASQTLDRAVSHELPVIARDLRAMAADLAETARDVRTLVGDIAGDGDTARRIRDTVSAVQRATQRVDKMTQDLSGVINEEQVRAVRASLAEAQRAITEARQGVAEIRQGVAEARGVIGRADRVVERAGRLLPEQLSIPGLLPNYHMDYELWYANARVGHDMRFTLLSNTPRRYVFTWRDIGGANRIGLQIGTQVGGTPGLWFRYGLIDGQPGVGLDYGNAPGPVYSLDVYNLNQLTLNFYATYFFQRDWGISLRGTGLLGQPVIGIGYFRRF
jgi:phospholipid/cholesterol/gamma-HCH transport system substrate-binding protein